MLYLFIKICVYHICGNAKACDPRHIVCSGTHTVLLSAAKDLRLYSYFFVNIEKAYALWSMDLVAAHRKKIDPQLFRIDTILSECLDGIYMKKCFRTFFMDKLSDLFYRHHSSHFIVHIHHRHQDRIRAQSCFQCIQFHNSLMINRKSGHLIALFLQISKRLGHCCMLYCSCDDMVSHTLIGFHTTDDSKVIRFCSTGGKKNLFFIHFQ